jgi:two-component system phosphate regulon response regulator PhoB
MNGGASVQSVFRAAVPAHESRSAAMVTDPGGVLVAGGIELDLAARRVRRNGHPIHLGPTEFRLLDFLMRHPGRVFSRAELVEGIWAPEGAVSARAVDVHVGRLRRALGSRNPIRTVRGFGYSFDEEFAAILPAEPEIRP